MKLNKTFKAGAYLPIYSYPKELSDKQFNGVILFLMKEIKQIHKLFLKKLTAFMSYCRRATETEKISKGFRDSNQIEQKNTFYKKKKGFYILIARKFSFH